MLAIRTQMLAGSQVFSRSLPALRPFSITSIRKAEGDTGSLRAGGQRHGDTWSRREKAAEDMYIKGREKEIMTLLKEKIKAQEMKLVEDRKLLEEMEAEYGDVDQAWERLDAVTAARS